MFIQIPVQAFLLQMPSYLCHHLMMTNQRKLFMTHVACILCSNMKFFEFSFDGVVEHHIKDQYYEEMSTKSDVVSYWLRCIYCYFVSLSTIVLNSRDWSEIVWLLKISRFKINLAIGFIRKKPTGMHWLGYNDAVSWLNKAKTRIFQPTVNFEIFEIYLYFVCLPACRPASLPASLP